MKVYRGVRDPKIVMVGMYASQPAGVPIRRAVPLPHAVYHSPTGLEWGYAGSGPADLALSILADYFGESVAQVEAAVHGFGSSRALALHQPFKFAFVAGFADDGWQLTTAEIDAWLAEHDGFAARLEAWPLTPEVEA